MTNLTQNEINILEYRLNKIESKLPMGYTVQIGVVLIGIDEHADGVLDFNSEHVRLSDVIVNNSGHCIKNRWGQTCY